MAALRSLMQCTRSNLVMRCWSAPLWRRPRTSSIPDIRQGLVQPMVRGIGRCLRRVGEVASGVAEYVQKIDPINHGWGQVEGKAMSEMLIYIFHPVVQHYLWHLSGVVPFSYIQGYAHTGKMDWTSSQCTQILDSFTVSWCFWRF